MTLTELQESLGKQIKVFESSEVIDDDMKCRGEMIAKLAKQMINNADVVLRYNKLSESVDLSKSNIKKLV